MDNNESTVPATADTAWDSARVRAELLTGLRYELIGPDSRDPEPWKNEELPAYDRPTKRYLAGYLVPAYLPQDEADLDDREDESLGGIEADGSDGEALADKVTRPSTLPSSMGLSVLLPSEVHQLRTVLEWGSYELRDAEGQIDKQGRQIQHWCRTQHRAEVEVPVTGHGKRVKVADSGLEVRSTVRPVGSWQRLGYPAGTKAVTVFVTNNHGETAVGHESFDHATTYQVSAALLLPDGQSFIARRDPRIDNSDPDDALGDLHYRDVVEFAVGHGVATETPKITWIPGTTGGLRPMCQRVATTWLPQQRVARVDPASFDGSAPAVSLDMDELAALASKPAADLALRGLADRYVAWIAGQRVTATHAALGTAEREAVATRLLEACDLASRRIHEGIDLLGRDPQALKAFALANQAMADARRQRDKIEGNTKASRPVWRPFQLAFVLMNLPGLAEATHADRQLVDLLFFPTGGGKTEAYLGLAAFAILLRRLKDPSWRSCGVTVFMRYTLRLLTLDQLGRATQLICALELIRQRDEVALGTWPFEIGLWVGSASTPNVLGSSGDTRDYTAYARWNAWKQNADQESNPVPIDNCPWCGHKLESSSYHWSPTPAAPTHLALVCSNLACAFGGKHPLPILAVDETIFRRLPCFVIGTADKIASLPWRAQVGKLFGHVRGLRRAPSETPRGKESSFVGHGEPDQRPTDTGELAGPDLIIQDELHLMSGPLGTMAGLYEVAVEALCERTLADGTVVVPKVVASTATIRRAAQQVRGLFGREQVAVFPPPGPSRTDSFFAREVDESAQNHGGRLYVGAVAPGKSSKVLLLRTYQALLSRAMWAWERAGGDSASPNPADPYMSLVGYFNALKELGASRRIVEDEVAGNLQRIGQRKPFTVAETPFFRRNMGEPIELTSRVDAATIARHKTLLANPWRHTGQGRCDVALATNMISVGLDIVRLGLMAVLHQPKSTAEYIQATSRVGRDPERPGLVVTMLNMQRTRDRSHFERFCLYHQQFYRSVESTSVTPFSPRALDRGLAPVVVGLARHLTHELTAPLNARLERNYYAQLSVLAERLAGRAALQALPEDRQALHNAVYARVQNLLARWRDRIPDAGEFPYDAAETTGGTQQSQLLFAPLAPILRGLDRADVKLQFVAPWSLRNVEHTLALKIDHEGAQIEG